MILDDPSHERPGRRKPSKRGVAVKKASTPSTEMLLIFSSRADVS